MVERLKTSADRYPGPVDDMESVQPTGHESCQGQHTSPRRTGKYDTTLSHILTQRFQDLEAVACVPFDLVIDPVDFGILPSTRHDLSIFLDGNDSVPFSG